MYTSDFDRLRKKRVNVLFFRSELVAFEHMYSPDGEEGFLFSASIGPIEDDVVRVRFLLASDATPDRAIVQSYSAPNNVKEFLDTVASGKNKVVLDAEGRRSVMDVVWDGLADAQRDYEAFKVRESARLGIAPRNQVSASLDPQNSSDLVFPAFANEFYEKGLSKQAIYDYIDEASELILQGLPGRKLFVGIRADKAVIRERPDKQTEDILVSDLSSLEKWNTGRTTGFYWVMGETTRHAWINVRGGEQVQWDLLRKIVKRLAMLLTDAAEARSVGVKFDGDKGFDIVIEFHSPIASVSANLLARSWVTHITRNAENIVVGKGDSPSVLSVNVDETRPGGSLLTPWSIHLETGLVSRPLKMEEIEFFDKKHAAIRAAIEKESSLGVSIDPEAEKKYGDKIRKALNKVRPDLERYELSDLLPVTNIYVGKLPETKIGKADEEGRIILDTYLLDDGKESILEDILFHELAHLRLRQTGMANGMGDEGREKKVLEMEVSRLRSKGLEDKKTQERIIGRESGWMGSLKRFARKLLRRAGVYSDKEMEEIRIKKTMDSVAEGPANEESKAEDLQYYHKWSPNSTDYPNDKSKRIDKESPSDLNYPRDKRWYKDFTYEVPSPAYRMALPAQSSLLSSAASLYAYDIYYDSKADSLEGSIAWGGGDIGDPDSLTKTLWFYLTHVFGNVRSLRLKDFDSIDFKDGRAEFCIDGAFGDKVPEGLGDGFVVVQDAIETSVRYNEQEYPVQLRVIHERPVVNLVKDHPELRDEDVSAIQGQALKELTERVERSREP